MISPYCPQGKENLVCPCHEYSKDGLCDWPYSITKDRNIDKQLSEIKRAAKYTDSNRKEALCPNCGVVNIKTTTVIATKTMYVRKCGKCNETIESCFFDNQ
jgi:hypothetical protein